MTKVVATYCDQEECWVQSGLEAAPRQHVHISVFCSNGEPMPGLEEYEGAVREVIARNGA